MGLLSLSGTKYICSSGGKSPTGLTAHFYLVGHRLGYQARRDCATNSIVSIFNRIFHLFQVCLHPRPDSRTANQNSEEGEVDINNDNNNNNDNNDNIKVDIRPGASEDS